MTLSLHLECLVEEPSAEALLGHILPRILPSEWTHKVRTFSGKPNLLKRLPDRLKSYAGMMRTDPCLHVLILVDQDNDDCLELKRQLEDMAEKFGLKTKSNSGVSGFRILNRIVVHELESWFFGDFRAVIEAYPRLPANYQKKAGYRYRQPDELEDAWETFEKLLQRHGYYPGGLAKVENAILVGQYMNPGRNTSRSFQVFRDGLAALAQQII